MCTNEMFKCSLCQEVANIYKMQDTLINIECSTHGTAIILLGKITGYEPVDLLHVYRIHQGVPKVLGDDFSGDEPLREIWIGLESLEDALEHFIEGDNLFTAKDK